MTVRGGGGGRNRWGVGGRLRAKTGRCPVDAIHERQLRSRPLWFRRTLDLIHIFSDSGSFVTAVVKLLDITLLGHAVIDLKVDLNVFEEETGGVTLKLETPQYWTRWPCLREHQSLAFPLVLSIFLVVVRFLFTFMKQKCK